MTNEALSVLVNTFASRIANKVMADEAYVEMMMEVLPEYVSKEIGINDAETAVELSMMLMDRLTLRSV